MSESVKPIFLKNILNHLKNNNYFYQDVVINIECITPDLIFVGFTENVKHQALKTFIVTKKLMI